MTGLDILITKWYRDIGEGLEFNHISVGYHPDHDEPAYVSEEQRRMWKGGIWVAERAVLRDGVVVPQPTPVKWSGANLCTKRVA